MKYLCRLVLRLCDIIRTCTVRFILCQATEHSYHKYPYPHTTLSIDYCFGPNGLSLKVGDHQFHPENSCLVMSCELNSIGQPTLKPSNLECSPLNCPLNKQYIPTGTCCPVCTCEFNCASLLNCANEFLFLSLFLLHSAIVYRGYQWSRP